MGKNKKKQIKDNRVVRNFILALSILVILFVLSFMFLDLYTKHGQKYSMPNLSGMTMAEAEEAVNTFNARLQIVDSLFIPSQKGGVILEQNPKPGSSIKSNRRVLLTINTVNPKQVVMPYVAGYSLRQAKNRIIAAGLEISKIEYQSDIATNNVILQRIGGREIASNKEELVNLGSGVELVVGLSSTDSKTMVPDITNLSIKGAKSLLWEHGLNVGEIVLDNDIDHSNIDDAVVFYQSILPLASMEYGSVVGISVTLNKELVLQTKEQLATRKKALTKIESQLTGYKDTLSILRRDKGKNTIDNAHGIVSPSDSLYYIQKIDALKQEHENIIHNITTQERK